MFRLSNNGSLAVLFLLSTGLLLTPGVSQDQISQIKAQESVTVDPPQIPLQLIKQTQPEVVPVAMATNQYSLTIDSINLQIPLKTTTLDKTGHLMVPENPNQAAWYTKGPKPGEAGTALITGHLDSLAGPGVFWNLKDVKLDDLIQVQKPDGSIVNFKVDKIESYGQDDSFPWKQVYSTKGQASIRIITCDGVYNSQTGHYSRNLVVYASIQ